MLCVCSTQGSNTINIVIINIIIQAQYVNICLINVYYTSGMISTVKSIHYFTIYVIFDSLQI